NKNWLSAFMLFLYAITFSYAYLSLDAGLGTLLLFGVVQLSMIVIAVFKKEKITLQKTIGMLIAFAGLVYLLYPSESFELSLFHCFLMTLAGIAWAVYTVLGKESTDALFNTSDNFTKALLFISILYLFFMDTTFISFNGILLACISGSLTSAIGYTIWYYVLPQLEIVTASIIQLIIPIIAIFFSIILLGEELSFTLFLSTVIILGGIIITLKRSNKSK
ncbi:MAG: DMT family transporter, partial [Campylobacteraceae bacterium]|nr:DMT family transporter [Campylobacteraceae bacterium]